MLKNFTELFGFNEINSTVMSNGTSHKGIVAAMQNSICNIRNYVGVHGSNVSTNHDGYYIIENGFAAFLSGFLTASSVFVMCYVLKKSVDCILRECKHKSPSNANSGNQNQLSSGVLELPDTAFDNARIEISDKKCLADNEIVNV
ncbi:hypothetical protein K6025_05195 [Ehrlichia sp. JZT12]